MSSRALRKLQRDQDHMFLKFKYGVIKQYSGLSRLANVINYKSERLDKHWIKKTWTFEYLILFVHFDIIKGWAFTR